MKKSNTKSARMIQEWKSGSDISSIAKGLGVRYNFVYNVVSRYCKKNHITMDTHTPEEPTKKSQILDLYKSTKLGYTEIAKKLDTHPSYVFQVVDEYRVSQ